MRAPANAACKRRIAISDTGRKGGKKKQGTKTKKRKVERGTGRKKRENIFPFRRGGQTKRRAPNRDVSRNPRAETRTKNPRSRYVTPPPPPPPSSPPPPSPLSEPSESETLLSLVANLHSLSSYNHQHGRRRRRQRRRNSTERRRRHEVHYSTRSKSGKVHRLVGGNGRSARMTGGGGGGGGGGEARSGGEGRSILPAVVAGRGREGRRDACCCTTRAHSCARNARSGTIEKVTNEEEERKRWGRDEYRSL